MISSITARTPTSLSDALLLLQERGEQAKVLAGGTDLMVYINTRVSVPREVVNIWGLEELRFIREEAESISVGALTTYTQMIRSPLLAAYCSPMIAASKTIGAAQIQNRGTLGGNVVNASPAGDSLPVLAAFDAELELASWRGVRRVPFNSFYTGYRSSVRKFDELLTAIRIPKPYPRERAAFYKVGARKAQAISKVVMACKAALTEEGEIESIQIALGSIAPTVIRAAETERYLSHRLLNQTSIAEAVEILLGEIKPIDDIRSTERYRRVVSGNLLRRFLLTL